MITAGIFLYANSVQCSCLDEGGGVLDGALS